MFGEPLGPGHTLRDVSIVFLVLSWVFVTLRLSVRYIKSCLGSDDWAMVGGLVLFSADCASTIIAAYSGVGAYDHQLSPEQFKEGRKWFFLFQIFYTSNTVAIKTSICIMLMRLTPFTIYQSILYGVIIFSTLSAFSVIIGLLTICIPVTRTWDPSVAGSCSSPSVMSGLGYFLSASCIVTDWSCAVLPIFILRNSRMRWIMKISIGVVLALGVLASTVNIIRFQFLVAYEDTTDYLRGVANIASWSLVESGTGIIAGSIPALAPLLKHIPIIGVGFGIPENGQIATMRQQQLAHIRFTFPSFHRTQRSTQKGQGTTGSSQNAMSSGNHRC